MSTFGKETEAKLRAEAEGWEAPTDLCEIPLATEDDISVLDLGQYLLTKDTNELQLAAERLKLIAKSTGFHYVVNHGIDYSLINECFSAAKKFHELPTSDKESLGITDGYGYLSNENKMLPARSKPNMNASFVVKQEPGPRNISLDCMPWPNESQLTSVAGFRDAVESYCAALRNLSMDLLPIYAVALDMPSNYFDEAFSEAMYRLRLSQYGVTPDGEYGINPHVDTSFFTLLATSGDGLVVQGKSNDWVRVPHMEGALVVNFGSILAQLTNDKWPATRHYAIHKSAAKYNWRYSLPFFFNATPSYRMKVLPSCCSPSFPPKYPTVSYLEGQGVIQGE